MRPACDTEALLTEFDEQYSGASTQRLEAARRNGTGSRDRVRDVARSPCRSVRDRAAVSVLAALVVSAGSAGAVVGGEGLFVGAGEGVEVALGGLDLGVAEAFHDGFEVGAAGE